MSRANFTKPTKRAALKRSGMECEAIGAWYGLAAGRRCNAPLSKGVQFDHIVLDANSKDNSLENCASVCVKCHDFKTRSHDTPTAAKTVRQQDAALGISAPKQAIPSRGFPASAKRQRSTTKRPLSARSLYGPGSGLIPAGSNREGD